MNLDFSISFKFFVTEILHILEHSLYCRLLKIISHLILFSGYIVYVYTINNLITIERVIYRRKNLISIKEKLMSKI